MHNCIQPQNTRPGQPIIMIILCWKLLFHARLSGKCYDATNVPRPRIRVVCADDHPIVLEGIRGVLDSSPDIEVVGTAKSGQEAVAMYRQHQPDIILMDLRMPGMSGLQAIEQIRFEFPDARIIVLTTYQGDEDIYQAIQAGAATYILKDMAADKLVPLVMTVFDGGRPIPGEVASRLVERVASRSLTRREIDVLEHIAKGCRNKEIAWELQITEETVQVHVKNILSKLKVHDRTEAVTVALRRGILHII
jgi:DNA-binding NarL/FixJ family response regulator